MREKTRAQQLRVCVCVFFLFQLNRIEKEILKSFHFILRQERKEQLHIEIVLFCFCFF